MLDDQCKRNSQAANQSHVRNRVSDVSSLLSRLPTFLFITTTIVIRTAATAYIALSSLLSKETPIIN